MMPCELSVIRALLLLARTAYLALDDSEEFEGDHGRCHSISGQAFDDIEKMLDTLDELPDDRPGYTLGPHGKAEWALRRILAPQTFGAATPTSEAEPTATSLAQLRAWEKKGELLERTWSTLVEQEREIIRQSALVNELRELLQDAKRAMTDLHQAAIPDESTEGVPAIIPPEAFAKFVDAHAMLCFCMHQRGHNPPQERQNRG